MERVNTDLVKIVGGRVYQFHDPNPLQYVVAILEPGDELDLKEFSVSNSYYHYSLSNPWPHSIYYEDQFQPNVFETKNYIVKIQKRKNQNLLVEYFVHNHEYPLLLDCLGPE